MKDLDPTKMSVDEISAKVLELRKELIKLNAQKSTGTSTKNPRQIKTTRKILARLLTAKREKEKNR